MGLFKRGSRTKLTPGLLTPGLLTLGLLTPGLIGAAVLGGCGTERVALNERLSVAATMEDQGGGCTLYELGGNDSESTESGGALGLVVRQTKAAGAREVVVDVMAGNNLIVERRYDEAFFQSGIVDEFTAAATPGNDMRLRYWGIFHPNGCSAADPAP